MCDMVTRKSKSTARDMVRGILEDVDEIPTLDGASMTADKCL